MHGIVNFDPLPLSATTLQRMNINRHQASLIQNHQQATAQQQQQQHQLQQQQQQQHHAMIVATRAAPRPTGPPLQTSFPNTFSSSSSLLAEREVPKSSIDPLLEELSLHVAGLSLEPMSGSDVLRRIETRTNQVSTRYLPCVDFLVQCQQELRKGLAAATSKRVVHHMLRDSMTPLQFYNTYIAGLPQRFYQKNHKMMDPQDLDAAVTELQKLCSNAQGVERQGCEIVKNTFLGGMKDGESWGLRKWLSNNGGALLICNDSECILHACRKLDRSLNSTRKLGETLRLIAKRALVKLRAEVPTSYQEHSTAHPYLPFFHRLEAALVGMSNFDPEDDDVICIDDDDEVEELKTKAPPPPRMENNDTSKRKKGAPLTVAPQAAKRCKSESPSDESEGNFFEILDTTANNKEDNSTKKISLDIDTNDDAAYMQELLKTFDDENSHDDFFGGADPAFVSITLPIGNKNGSDGIANRISRLAGIFEIDQSNLVRPSNISRKGFWDQPLHYASALRLFVDILRDPDAYLLVEPADQGTTGMPPYASIIRHPICFGEIASSLVEDTDDVSQTITANDGRLTSDGLAAWNMWRGFDLLHAIDLVLLNSLAYGKAANEGRSMERSKTNKMRKMLWAGIKSVVDSSFGLHEQEEKKKCTPTRRGESSGFVVFKEK
jgi:hypothetical protein